MRSYEHLGLHFDEQLNGWLGVGRTDPVDGRMVGQMFGTTMRLKAHVTIDNLRLFMEQPDHSAELGGVIDFAPLGEAMAIEQGRYNVLVIDARTGARQMIYEAVFQAPGGERYFLRGIKHIVDDPGFDTVKDMSNLFVVVYHGTDDRGSVYGAGQLFAELSDAPKFLSSIEVIGPARFGQSLGAKLAFLSFAYGILRDVYVGDVNPMFNTSYQNVVLQGMAQDDAGNAQPFFLVSGIHEKDFPWGDGESFCDVLLVLGDPNANPRCFAIAGRRLDAHRVDAKEGVLQYEGPIFDVSERRVIAFSDMQEPSAHAPMGQAKLSIRFQSRPHPLAPIPFAINEELLDRLSYKLREMLRRVFPSEQKFGFQIIPHTLSGASGKISLQFSGAAQELNIDSAKTIGEAEDSTICNAREPTLLYGYICALRKANGAARIQFHSGSLQNEREHWGKDRLFGLMGVALSHFATREIDVQPAGALIKDYTERKENAPAPKLFEKLGEPVLQLRLDHFPTAVFKRKVIQVKDPSGEICMALEEAMDTLRCESIESHRETTVAAIRGGGDMDKFKTLDRALEAGRFWQVLEQKRAASGKSKADFWVLIKPNFMFAYNRKDRSTYTDPELVTHLAKQLRNAGYTRISVVEAHSTYNEYFNRRTVREVAEYLGLSMDGSIYDIVDLTLDEQEMRHFGTALGYHPLPKTWRDADFRISFAKNKTHAYVYYTLTLKNIYGALALGNKFKEYHCDRGIAATTVEYIAAFPIHFGIIDGWISADGPFGIFADPIPNETKTMIAGEDVVAVDWVGASKMGLDPRISSYMKYAIRAFGKPKINFIGDASVYQPWLNVPVALTLFATFGLDANHYFGNLMYMSVAYMDEEHFTMKSRSSMIQAVRAAIRPLQEVMFLQSSGRNQANQALSRLFTWLGKELQHPPF